MSREPFQEFTIPILTSQFQEIDILMATLPGVCFRSVNINHKKREVTIQLGLPPQAPTLFHAVILAEILEALQANADSDRECACKVEEACPLCIAANITQVYCWARQYFPSHNIEGEYENGKSTTQL